MGLIDTLRTMFPGMVPNWRPESVELSTIEDEIRTAMLRRVGAPMRTYRLPSVKEALGVPAYQSAVSLIAGTTGMLSVMGFRNGTEMGADTPRLFTRPDPREMPYAFYAGTAAQMAKWGEFVWWIGSRDSGGFATALVLVPLAEIQIMENPADRVRPFYRWGNVESTRWTPASPNAQFVHVKYPLAEPFALRGEGPLQLCGAAASVAVESQAWAAQFYADGGSPSITIKHAGELSPALDAEGMNEADHLRDQFVNRPHNTPRVIDQNIESITYGEVNESGAQMLEAREHNNGDAARVFRIPGPLLEYQQPGGSLTYQNRADLKGEFWETCLQPLYVEPIEQALSDLAPRSVVARFNAKGFLRADIKTRYEVHAIAVANGIYGSDYAQREEGIIPGDIEFAPVPFTSPAAVPATMPRYASTEMRDVRCPSCRRLVVKASGAVEAWCRHCKVSVTAEDMRELSGGPVAAAPIEFHLHMSEGLIQSAQPITITTPDIHNEIHLPATTVNTPEVHNEFTVAPAVVSPTPVEIHNDVTVQPAIVEPTPVQIHNDVNPTPVEIHNDVRPTPIQVAAPSVSVTNMTPDKQKVTKRVVRNKDNQITAIVEETTNG